MSGILLQDLLRRICQNSYNVIGAPLLEVILFGSYARGDYHEESDIDIALIIDQDRESLRGYQDELTHIASEFSLNDDVLVSFISIPAKEFEYWKQDLPFYRNVDTEGVRLSA